MLKSCTPNLHMFYILKFLCMPSTLLDSVNDYKTVLAGKQPTILLMYAAWQSIPILTVTLNNKHLWSHDFYGSKSYLDNSSSRSSVRGKPSYQFSQDRQEERYRGVLKKFIHNGWWWASELLLCLLTWSSTRTRSNHPASKGFPQNEWTWVVRGVNPRGALTAEANHFITFLGKCHYINSAILYSLQTNHEVSQHATRAEYTNSNYQEMNSRESLQTAYNSYFQLF